MPVEVIYKNRRSDTDRRKKNSNYEGPERRKGVDRRKLDDRLKLLLEKQNKTENENKQPFTTIQTDLGKILVRRRAR